MGTIRAAPAPLVEFRNVSVARGARIVLKNINLSIAAGENVAILGPNGSGKSTLIKTITRECYPLHREGAAVRLLGQERWNVFDLRLLMGIVSQDLVQACVRDIPAREVIISGFFSSIGLQPWHRVTPAMEAKTEAVLDLLEIRHLAHRPVEELSTGEARRVVMGRALVHDPQALVLDEPSNSLDLRAVCELRDVLRKIAAAGAAIILVTHQLADIIPEIGRVVVMRQGEIFRDGPKEQVLTSAVLTELFGRQVMVEERGGYYHVW